MPHATLTSKGQVTIPQEVRLALGLHEGSRLDFQLQPDGTVRVVPQRRSLLDLQGRIKPARRGVTIDDMKNAAMDGAVLGE